MHHGQSAPGRADESSPARSAERPLNLEFGSTQRFSNSR
jgi:hypothetical protein